MMAFGMRVIESTAACTYERARTYPKRKAKSKRHWARMDKKYAKRYGMVAKPTAYLMDTSLLSAGLLRGYGGRQVFVVHPAIAAEYRKAINDIYQEASALENRI